MFPDSKIAKDITLGIYLVGENPPKTLICVYAKASKVEGWVGGRGGGINEEGGYREPWCT